MQHDTLVDAVTLFLEAFYSWTESDGFNLDPELDQHWHIVANRVRVMERALEEETRCSPESNA